MYNAKMGFTTIETDDGEQFVWQKSHYFVVHAVFSENTGSLAIQGSTRDFPTRDWNEAREMRDKCLEQSNCEQAVIEIYQVKGLYGSM